MFFVVGEVFRDALRYKTLTSVTLHRREYQHNFDCISILNYTIEDKIHHVEIPRHKNLSEVEIDGILNEREPECLRELKWDLISLRDSHREKGYDGFSYNIYEILKNLEFIETSMTDYTGHHLGDGYIFILSYLYDDSLAVSGKSIQQTMITTICKKACTECIIDNGGNNNRSREPYNLNNAIEFLNFLTEAIRI